MKKETKEKAISICKDILLSIGVLGVATIAVGMGNAVQLLKYTSLGGKKTKYKTYQIDKSVKSLLNRGLLEITEDKYNKYLKVTEKGSKLLIKYKLESLQK